MPVNRDVPRHRARHRTGPAPRPARQWPRHLRRATRALLPLALLAQAAVLGVVAWHHPIAGLIGACWAVTLVVVRWTPGYVALRAELEAVRRRLDSVNTSQNAEDLAKVVRPAPATPGPATPATSPTAHAAAGLGGLGQHELVPVPAREPAADGVVVWCVQIGGPGAPWCALFDDQPPAPGDMEAETCCGYMGDLPAPVGRRRPDCLECQAILEGRPPQAPPPSPVVARIPAQLHVPAPLAPGAGLCDHFGHGAGPCPDEVPVLGVVTAEGPLTPAQFLEHGAHVAADGTTHAGPPPQPVARHCRVCACTQGRACLPTCWWVRDPEGIGDLCSVCLPLVEHAAVAPVPQAPPALPDVPMFTVGPRR